MDDFASSADPARPPFRRRIRRPYRRPRAKARRRVQGMARRWLWAILTFLMLVVGGVAACQAPSWLGPARHEPGLAKQQPGATLTGAPGSWLALVLATGVLAISGAAWAMPAEPDPTGGRAIAQRNCGECHAVAQGVSPLADAPPFRELWRRYPRGRLDLVLQEGMLRPNRMPEEGSPRTHPRMPMADLGEDEVAALRAYLSRLDPRP